MRFQKARRVTPHRKRPVIFVGCEGDAEDEYFVWLQQFLNQLQLPGELNRAIELAQRANVTLVVQQPCVEAHIVRHFPNLNRKKFNSTQEAKRFLRNRIGLGKIERYELGQKMPSEADSLIRASELTTGFDILLQAVGVISAE